MAHAERRWLVESLRARLVPELERRGYHAVPLTAAEARSEIRTGFPFGRLRREAADRFDLVEIQLDKHGRAAFRFNLGVVPLEGIEHEIVGHVRAEDVWVHYLAHYYVLYDWPRLRRWFSPWRWPGTALGRNNYERLVAKVVSLLPEVEALFREGKGGATSGRWERASG
jgi:hypothetical protein